MREHLPFDATFEHEGPLRFNEVISGEDHVIKLLPDA